MGVNSHDYCPTCGTEQMVNTTVATIECGSSNHRYHWVLVHRCSAVSHLRVQPIGYMCDDCDLTFPEDRMEPVR